MAGLPNLNPNNQLAAFCDDGTGIPALVFDGTNNNPGLAIVQGANTLLFLDQTNFFIPLASYQTMTFKVPASGSATLTSDNIASGLGEVQFIGIFVTFPDIDNTGATIDTTEKYLTWQCPVGGQQYTLGKIMLLSGSTKPGFGWDLEVSPGGILIQNPHTNYDVTVRVLTFN